MSRTTEATLAPGAEINASGSLALSFSCACNLDIYNTCQSSRSVVLPVIGASPIVRMICRPTITMGSFVPTVSINGREFVGR